MPSNPETDPTSRPSKPYHRTATRAGSALITLVLLFSAGWPLSSRAAHAPPPAAPAATSEKQKSLELLMASQRMDKREMLKAALELNQAQSDRFWPIYYEYQALLIPIYDRKFALIEQYADEYPNLTERQADHLVRESLAAKKAQI